MNDADDALSKSARALTNEPSGDSTRTWQVMSNMFALIPTAACVETGVVTGVVAESVPGV